MNAKKNRDANMRTVLDSTLGVDVYLLAAPCTYSDMYTACYGVGFEV